MALLKQLFWTPEYGFKIINPQNKREKKIINWAETRSLVLFQFQNVLTKCVSLAFVKISYFQVNGDNGFYIGLTGEPSSYKPGATYTVRWAAGTMPSNGKPINFILLRSNQ